MKPVLLDLFCGAGGATKGYQQAGFHVIGVDINPQPRYVGDEFHQADALEFLGEALDKFYPFNFVDAIHASPPCQRYSDLAKRNGNAHLHPDLVGEVRELLKVAGEDGVPWVIENVEGAPLIDPVMLCGTRFGLKTDDGQYRLRRHRLFESNVNLLRTMGCHCYGNLTSVIDVSGGGPSKKPRTDGKGGRTYKGTADEARQAMGIPWMTKAELNEAIPPAYTQFIGSQLIASLRGMSVSVA